MFPFDNLKALLPSSTAKTSTSPVENSAASRQPWTNTQRSKLRHRAAAVRASFFAAQPLFLKSCSRPTYLSFVREHFPALEADYAARFTNADFVAPAYRRQMAALVEDVCQRYGLAQRSTDALLTREWDVLKKRAESYPVEPQQRLFG